MGLEEKEKKMPKGVYPRTQNQLEAAVKNLAKGRTPEVRKKVAKILKENAKDPAWREKISEATRSAMHRPDVRKRHLAGLKLAISKHGVNFRGGNGQKPTEIVKQMEALLSPLGFMREHSIPTKWRENNFQNVPDAYKADFANPEQMIVIELDGVCHRGKEQRERDKKKTKTLEALGWIVLRLEH